MISEQWTKAADPRQPGHAEEDFIIIRHATSAIGTLFAPATRRLRLLRLPPLEGLHSLRAKVEPPLLSLGAEAVRKADAATTVMRPEQLWRSLCSDQAAEVDYHAMLRVDTGLTMCSTKPPLTADVQDTRTRTASCVSTSPRGPTSRTQIAATLTPSLSPSTHARER